MTTCDARDCTARATREIWYDSGNSLYACSHHCADWLPWMTTALRYAPEDITIIGA